MRVTSAALRFVNASDDVLFAESRDVGSALPGEQQQHEREKRLRSNRVAFLEFLNFFHRLVWWPSEPDLK
jgi:hypothetical protein